MKPHETETGIKQCQKRRGKTKDDKKNQFDKRRKDNKTLSKKAKSVRKKTLTEDKKEPKIKVSSHELLAFTLSYLMLAPC
jgi:hypothetical protein